MNITSPLIIGEYNHCGEVINCIQPEKCVEMCQALIQQQTGYFVLVPVVLLVSWMLFSIIPDEEFRVKHIEKLSGITILVLVVFFYILLTTY